MIKKFLLLFIILLFYFPLFTYASEDTIQLRFSNKNFLLKYDEDGFTIPIVEGYSNIDTFSDKSFPRKNIKVLLPPNTKFLTYKILNLNTIKLDGKHKLREGNLPLIAETNYKYNFKENEFKINKPIYFLNENNKKVF